MIMFFLSLCSAWLPRQFSLNIFYLILSPLVYLAEKVLSPFTSKWLWSFVQYFTIQISEAQRLKWWSWFVHFSITAEWAHKNNHISIVIWRRRSGNDLFALNYQQLNSYLSCIHIITDVQSNIYGHWKQSLSIHKSALCMKFYLEFFGNIYEIVDFVQALNVLCVSQAHELNECLSAQCWDCCIYGLGLYWQQTKLKPCINIKC